MCLCQSVCLKQNEVATWEVEFQVHSTEMMAASLNVLLSKFFQEFFKGRFTRYDFCLRLSDAIFVARAARVMKKSYTISTISNLPVATIVVGF